MKSATLLALAAIPVAFVLLNRRRGPDAGEEERWPEDMRLLEPRLFHPPPQKNEEDRLYDQWIRDPRSGAVLADVDLNPRRGSRRLTAFEKWALRPYFPYAPDLDDPVINQGIKPPGFEDETMPAEVLAATSPVDRQIYFPHEPKDLTDRWWLAALAHELWHVAQIRIGMTPAQGRDAVIKWGYESSPIEVQARYQQARVYDGLAKSARTFFGAA